MKSVFSCFPALLFFFCFGLSTYSTATTSSAFTVTPLIESVSIVLPHQVAAATSTVRFKPAGDSHWQQANPLYFDPTTSALAGVIVYLQPASTYDIEVQVTQPDGAVVNYSQQVSTRPDAPPVDPDKIYHLADIYHGGTLDIEALGIAGEPGAWAMIKGDPATPIVADKLATSAIWLGAQSYIYFEDITIARAGIQGFHADSAHHIWVNGCDIANWGRPPAYYNRGIAHDENREAINYDSAFFLQQSGVITIENCYVHSPAMSANHWGNGHPRGTNAFIAYANHPDPAFEGQIILRNNTFTGSPDVRFNDVIESRFNGEVYGGFIRDSAIYNNKFAYANDDLIELDGGQQNVLVYNNDFSHGYAGISTAPNMRGPSFIFNNTIHDMGDERGKMWASVKMGGLYAKPQGQVNLFYNYMDVYRNGITASNVDGDDAFWVNAINNFIITHLANSSVGYTIYDLEQAPQSDFINNYLYNLKTDSPRFAAIIDVPFSEPDKLNSEFATQIQQQMAPKHMTVPQGHQLANFTRTVNNLPIIGIFSNEVGAPYWQPEAIPGAIDFTRQIPESYTLQNADNLASIPAHHQLMLQDNTWQAINGDFTLTENSILSLMVYGKHHAEIAGIGFDSNNRIARQDIVQFYGSQPFGMLYKGYQAGQHQSTLSVNLAEFFAPGNYSQMVFALDNDKPLAGAPDPRLIFSNVLLYNALNFNDYPLNSYDPVQDDPEYGQSHIDSTGRMLTLTGNSWKHITGNFTIDADTVLVAEVKIDALSEVVGIGFDNDNSVVAQEVISLGGLQTYGHVFSRQEADDGWQRVAIPVGNLLTPGIYKQMTFINDNDAVPSSGKVTFKNVGLIQP